MRTYAVKKELERLKEEIILRQRYESFLKSLIIGGEKWREDYTFEWFCDRQDDN